MDHPLLVDLSPLPNRRVIRTKYPCQRGDRILISLVHNLRLLIALLAKVHFPEHMLLEMMTDSDVMYRVGPQKSIELIEEDLIDRGLV